MVHWSSKIPNACLVHIERLTYSLNLFLVLNKRYMISAKESNHVDGARAITVFHEWHPAWT